MFTFLSRVGVDNYRRQSIITTPSKGEALAVVGAVKEFYPYLYDFSFKLITDHNPLTSLRGIKDTGGRLTRSLLFLQQFNFTVEYKKGTSHSNEKHFV